VSSPDLEARATGRVKEALNAATLHIGKDEFAKLAGLEKPFLNEMLERDGEFVSVSVITLACQINKSHGDQDPSRTSISECLKGAILRLPQRQANIDVPLPVDPSTARNRRTQFYKAKRRAGRIYDPSTLRIAGFSVNLFTFLVLGYFLGGLVLGPLFGFGACVGVVVTSPWLTPCAGSGIGLVFGSVIGIAYTFYYFVRKV